MTGLHVYQVGDKVISRMSWNSGAICTVIDTQPPITMNDAVLVNQYIVLQYSDNAEDISGWLSASVVRPV